MQHLFQPMQFCVFFSYYSIPSPVELTFSRVTDLLLFQTDVASYGSLPPINQRRHSALRQQVRSLSHRLQVGAWPTRHVRFTRTSICNAASIEPATECVRHRRAHRRHPHTSPVTIATTAARYLNETDRLLTGSPAAAAVAAGC
jgi:hypothetical protein